MEDSTLSITFKVIMVLAIFVIAGSVFYYYVIFTPQIDKAKLEQQKQLYKIEEIRVVQEKEIALEKLKFEREVLTMCLNDARANYQANLENICANLGEAKGCAMPGVMLDDCNKKHQLSKEMCYTRFPQASETIE
ncbi:hypothetical protein ACFL1E_03535 [Candidatus Omnitrophota bacterium]